MIRLLYKKALKPILFKMDPEYVHDVFVKLGNQAGKWSLGRHLLASAYKYKGPSIEKEVDGIKYNLPLQLAAGFDYNGKLAHVLDCISFGGEEIGSVTARPCKGNEKPRLKRMIKSQALVVYKGLKNDGVEAIIQHLKKTKKPVGFIWGISIAKTNDAQSASMEEGIEDYCYSFRRLNEEQIGDFYTINISCPNVHGGESFTTPEMLEPLLNKLTQIPTKKPVYIKMPINLKWEEFNELLSVIDKYPVQGVVIGNLNKKYEDADFPEEAPENYRGGLSGKTCRKLSTELIRKTKENWKDRFTIIGCGGILTVSDAMEKLDAGADLLQMITGMIFEGPHLMKDIASAIAEKNISQKKEESITVESTR
ncbi:MAG: quinone-dependent dihydroorotate dehydrogenase [Chitinophagaceae bacterium]|nr:MAG: quinone-dependent dihydroorotate dehydrogenase [Chitinophagaceae bacterium]